MKFRNLFSIRFTSIVSAVFCLVIFAACSPEKKEAATEKQNENSSQRTIMAERYGEINIEKTSGTEDMTLFALINENNAPIYSSPYDEYKPVGYLQREDVVSLKSKTREKIEIEGNHDNLYFFSPCFRPLGVSIQEKWIHGRHLNFFSIPSKFNETSLTNSEEINHELFPIRMGHVTEYVGREGIGTPGYLDNLDDWIVFTGGLGWWGTYILTIHLKNLPKQFDVLIYTSDEGGYLRFSGEKEEFNIEEYKDFLDDNDKAVLDKVWPVYTFYYPAPLAAFSGQRKTEIRSKDNDLIFSTYLDYPAAPFRISKLDNRNFYIQYCTDTPFYLVIYPENYNATFTTHSDYFERAPVKALAAYPKNGLWSGLLSFFPESLDDKRYLIYLYRIDKNNPEDYTQLIKGSWNNYIDID